MTNTSAGALRSATPSIACLLLLISGAAKPARGQRLTELSVAASPRSAPVARGAATPMGDTTATTLGGEVFTTERPLPVRLPLPTGLEPRPEPRWPVYMIGGAAVLGGTLALAGALAGQQCGDLEICIPRWILGAVIGVPVGGVLGMIIGISDDAERLKEWCDRRPAPGTC